ncbi:MAG: hypothetical protein ACXAE3_05850 [Candidatus Kariarchaeaceae archaeon]|jgi:hypothetical protein
MNLIEKLLWKWQGKSKIGNDNPALQYTAMRKLGEIGSATDLELLLPYLADSEQIKRNTAALAIRDLILQQQDTEVISEMRDKVVMQLENARSLIERISLIEITRHFPLDLRETLLAPLIVQSEADLQYVAISSITDTQNLEILDTILDASNTNDMVLKRMALQTWYEGIANQELEKVQDYITPRLHYLVRAVYELGTDGEFLRKALSYSKKKNLPHPKAYPDFMIRYVTELLGKWDYDPDAYRSLHAIMVPSYFTFSKGEEEQETYVQL